MNITNLTSMTNENFIKYFEKTGNFPRSVHLNKISISNAQQLSFL